MSQVVYVDRSPGQINFTGLLLGAGELADWEFLNSDDTPQPISDGVIVLWPGDLLRQQRRPLTVAGHLASWPIDEVAWGTWAPYVLFTRVTLSDTLRQTVAGEIGTRGRVLP